MTAAPNGISPRTGWVDLSAWDVPHERPFVCDIVITPDQLSGTIEHVSNTEYVRWLDRAAELHADHLGYTRERLLDDGPIELTYESTCRILPKQLRRTSHQPLLNSVRQ